MDFHPSQLGSTHTGDVTVNAHTFTDPLSIIQATGGAGSISIAGHVQNSGGGIALTSVLAEST